MMLLVTAAWLPVRLRLKLITGVSKSPAEVNKPTTRVGKPGAVINGMVSTSPRIYHYLGFTALLLIWAFTLTAYFPGGSVEKNLPANAGDASLMPELGRPPEKEMATHFSILVWEIPWTEEPGSSWGCKESDKT